MQTPETENATSQDEQHLQLLSIFHYVVAAMVACFSCLPIFHLAFGIFALVAPEAFDGGKSQGAPMTLLGLIFTIIPALIMLTGWTLAICVLLSGRFLARRKRYMFCLIIAGVICLFMPVGTILGVFAIIVLVRPSVKAMFEGQSPVDLQEK